MSVTSSFTPGTVVRLAIAGTDWPNCWPAPGPLTLSVDAASVEVDLPVVDGLPASIHAFAPGTGPSEHEADGVVWSFAHDVLARESTVVTRYGDTYTGRHGATVTDDYRGEVGISTRDPSIGWARGTSSYLIAWPEATVRTESTLEVTSDRERLVATIVMRAWDGDELVCERSWTSDRPRR